MNKHTDPEVNVFYYKFSLRPIHTTMPPQYIPLGEFMQVCELSDKKKGLGVAQSSDAVDFIWSSELPV